MKHFQITLISFCIICMACSKTNKKYNLLVSSLEMLNQKTVSEIDNKLRIIERNIDIQPKYKHVLTKSREIDSLRVHSTRSLKGLKSKTSISKIDSVMKINKRFLDYIENDLYTLPNREIIDATVTEDALVEYSSNWLLSVELDVQTRFSMMTQPFCQSPDLVPFYVTVDLKKNQNTRELKFEIPSRMSEYSIDGIMFGENKIEGNPRLKIRPATVTLKFKQPLKAGKYDISGNQIIRHMCF